MTDRWLPAWGLTAVAFGGASLVAPLYVVELGGDAFDLGLMFATASFVGVPGALLIGNLADRTGRGRAFVLGTMAVTVGTVVAMPMLERLPLVIVTNALLWFGFAAATPVVTLMVVEGAPEAEWSGLIARLNRYQGIGWAVGLALGVAIVAGATTVVEPITGQRWFFFACAASAGLGLVLAVRTLPPDSTTGTGPSPRRLRRRLRESARFNVRGAAFPFTPPRIDVRDLHHRRFVDRFTPRLGAYFGAVLLAFTGFGVFFAPLPTYLSGVGYGSTGIFVLYLVLNLGAAVFYGPAAGLAGRYDLLRLQGAGLLARSVAFVGVAAIGVAVGGSLLGTGTYVLVFLGIGMSWAVVAVTAGTLVTTLAPAGIRGEALGVYSALTAVGGGVGGLLGGWLAVRGYLVAFGVAGGLVAAGAAVAVGLSLGATASPARRSEAHR